MQETVSALKSKKENRAVVRAEETRSLESTKKSEVEIQSESNSLSKNLATQLMTLINDVNNGGVTPETVNASCNAASQIYKILRLNFEMKKEGF